MKILVACEESQVVTKAFRAKGHEAYSCDILDCSGGHPGWHIKDDVLNNLKGWGLIIMHPPCTAMSVCGNSTYGLNKDKTPKEKHYLRIAAVMWTQNLWNSAISCCEKVCMENPVGVLNSLGCFPKPQYVQPYMFGHLEQKNTGLWLCGLHHLKETNNVYSEMMKLPKKKRERIHYLPPSENRAQIRSITFQGIADAMAEQWG